jgi:HlyD family secretion protein
MKTLKAIAAVLLFVACGDDEPDAYGNFEAQEITVSAEVGGELRSFTVEEGARIGMGAVVGQIDPTTLELRRDELAAQQAAVQTRVGEATAQVGVLRAQLTTARNEYARTQRLFEAEAATAQQLNLARGEVRVLEERIEAALAQSVTVRNEVRGADARIRQVNEQIGMSRITNPAAGTVTARFAESGELVQPGQPLYKIAQLETMTLRAYVSGAQLAQLRLNRSVQIRFDAGEDLVTRNGVVTWIASEAEFTPTPIQTRDERTEQVYAVEIRVPNADGLIKIGMPGEVVFGS